MNFSSLFKGKTYIIVLVFINCSLVSFSQNQDDTNNFWRHVHFGGGLGLSFADGFFSGTIAPSAIYEINDQFFVGLGLNGTYNSLKNTYSSTIFGGSVIGLFNPIPEIQISGEFEELNVNRKFENNLYEDDNYWYPALYLGLGYTNRNVTFGIRYDVLYDIEKSIYADPWAPFVRVYF